MMDVSPTIFIVDDDPSARSGLERLIKAAGYAAVSYSSASAFLEENLGNRHGCLLLDCNMPGISGPQLQEELLNLNCPIPIVFISAFGDVPTTANTMKKGAVDFLTKPADSEDLMNAIQSALDTDLARFAMEREIESLQVLLDSLTKREYQVMTYVITGLLNKQIAWELEITEDTVKIHRHRVMKKLKLESVAELVRFCMKAGVKPAETRDTY